MEENKNTIVGKKLKAMREKLNLTQEQVAKELNLGRDAIVRIESGKRKITYEELKQFAKIYNFDEKELTDSKKEQEIKGIILAGGSGTRLYPITKGTSKQLIPIYNKPMIYYPLSVLMQAGIKDILVITTEEEQNNFIRLLKDGKQFGINLTYKIQPKPEGLAQALVIGKEFIGDYPCAMILGDNIFYGSGIGNELSQAINNLSDEKATIFGYKVKDPQRFGIMELGYNNTVLSVEEKPANPKSEYAITGLYFYPKGVSNLAETIKKSARGEYEITTLNELYLKQLRLKARLLDDNYVWLDTGTFESMLDACNMIKALEFNKDTLICSPEKIAFDNGWINEEQLKAEALEQSKNEYGKKLLKILERK